MQGSSHGDDASTRTDSHTAQCGPCATKQTAALLHTDATPPSPLHTAVYHGNVYQVSALLDQWVDVREVIVGGQTPLHTAVRLCAAHPDERLAIIDELLQHKADISTKDDVGNNVLHYAASEQAQVLRRILERTPQGPVRDEALRAQNRTGCTPLVLAVQAGNIGAVQLLAPPPHSAVGVADLQGATALHHAAELTPYDDATEAGVSLEIAELLLRNTDIDVAACTHNGDTALHFAASRGGAALVKLLVEKSPGTTTSAEAKNGDGHTPLDLAKLSDARATLSNEQLRFAGFPGHTANRYAVITALEAP